MPKLINIIIGFMVVIYALIPFIYAVEKGTNSNIDTQFYRGLYEN